EYARNEPGTTRVLLADPPPVSGAKPRVKSTPVYQRAALMGWPAAPHTRASRQIRGGIAFQRDKLPVTRLYHNRMRLPRRRCRPSTLDIPHGTRPLSESEKLSGAPRQK